MSDATMSQTDSSENLSESNMTAKDSKVLGRGSDVDKLNGSPILCIISATAAVRADSPSGLGPL